MYQYNYIKHLRCISTIISDTLNVSVPLYIKHLNLQIFDIVNLPSPIDFISTKYRTLISRSVRYVIGNERLALSTASLGPALLYDQFASPERYSTKYQNFITG